MRISSIISKNQSIRISKAVGKRRSQTTRSIEALEHRVVLAANVLITEIVTNNQFGLEDEDGDSSDWIELYNAGDESTNLSGWYLSDSVGFPKKWAFPSVQLDPHQYLIVFASGKDRADPHNPLHTDFRLARQGEYLGLFQPDGTNAFEFAPRIPDLLADRSFGIPQDAAQNVVVEAMSNARVLVPSVENGGDQLGTSWTEIGFDDHGWTDGIGGVGFERGRGFEEHFNIDVENEMFDINASVFVRYPFHLDNPQAIFSVDLRMKYDDGFVAFLNGTEIARRNAPSGIVPWNGDATTTHRDAFAKQFEEINLASVLELLVSGENVLAIHGLNSTLRSDDFLIAPEFQMQEPLPITDTSPRYFAFPTPGQPNGLESFDGMVPPVTASVERGFYNEPFDVKLSTETRGATLVYTTNGSEPTMENGTIVSPAEPNDRPSTELTITRTTNLRANAFLEGHFSGNANTQTYVMLSDVLTQDVQATLDAGFPEKWNRTDPDYGVDPDVVGPNDKYDGEFANQILDALRAVPTVSIAMNLQDLFGENGIYTNSTRTGFDWERPTSVEFIYPDSTHVQADAGIRIQGDNVRTFGNSKKQSFRLEFRGRYGPTKLRFPIFGEDATDSFDTIILRGAYNDGWVHTPSTTQYIRDQWARTTLLEMGRPQVHGQFMHVYLNGFYWGVYNTVERPNATFSSDYSGGDKDDWDTLNTGQVRDGNAAAWGALRGGANDVRDDDVQQSNAAFLRLLGKGPDGIRDPNLEILLDVGNYIDYMIVNFYGGNVDWPGRNYYIGRLRGPESTGFQFYAWDTEKIIDHGEGSNISTNRINSTDGVAAPFRALRENAEFRLLFADHVHRHFFDGGALYVDPENPEWDPENPERNLPAARYSRLANDVELALIGESARWGDTQSVSTRNDGRTYTLIDWRKKRDNIFERYFPRRSDIVLRQFRSAGLYPELDAPAFNKPEGIVEPFELSMTAPGTIYYTMDGTDPRQSALDPGVDVSGISPTALEYSGAIPVGASVVVKARTFAEDKWSALHEATFTVGIPPLRVSEIMYHPDDPESGPFEDEDFEFVEVVNISATETVNTVGIRFTDGIEFVFPEIFLKPGDRTVVARNSEAFQQRYGDIENLAGAYGDEFRLSNSSETIRLEDPLGVLIHEFTYQDSWHRKSDGGGYSLTIRDEHGTLDRWNQSDGWRASIVPNGSPGIDDDIDFNEDGQHTAEDVDRFCSLLPSRDSKLDLNRDGVVSYDDMSFLIQDILRTQIGDLDLDGRFGTKDLVKLFQAGEYEDQVDGNSLWSEGDWDCDGDATTSDLVLAFISGGYRATATADLDRMHDDIFAAIVFEHEQRGLWKGTA